MFRTISGFLGTLLILATFCLDAEAQFRDNLPSGMDLTGNVVKAETSPDQLFGLVNFQMSHSYEMSFGSFAGQGYNQNIYTNTMHLLFNDRLRGRVDLSVAHSPFGNGLTGREGPQFFIRNAQLSYDITDSSNISLSFSQVPYSQFFNPFHHNPYNRSPFSRYHGIDPFGSW
jgi:hypothetical protein